MFLKWTLPVETVEHLGLLALVGSHPNSLLRPFRPFFLHSPVPQLPPFAPHWPQLSSLPVPAPTNPSLLPTIPLVTPPPTLPWPPAQHESTFLWCEGAAHTCDTHWARKTCAEVAMLEHLEEALQPRRWVCNGPTVIRTWSHQTAAPPLLPPPISSPWEEDKTSSSPGTSRRRWTPQTGSVFTTLVRFSIHA